MAHKFKLDKFQEDAINYAREGYSVIVSAPTGAGKTLIAEYIIEECIRNQKGVVYTAPIKALSNQKFRDFSKNYSEKVGILTGDVSLNPAAPLIIMTTEIFRNALLTSPDRFKDIDWVIFDEIHYLDDIERGTVWEEAIILLPQHMRILALSATIPNIDEFVNWMNSLHHIPVKKVEEKRRPVPLHFRFQCENKIFDNIKELKKSRILKKRGRRNDSYYVVKPNKLAPLISHLQQEDKLPCIYFSFSRRKCEILAEETYDFDFLNSEERRKITSLFKELVSRFNLSGSEHINYLYPFIRKGIAYHHAGLLPTLKEIIERLFSTGLIKMIFTTETFALGINMPARTVIFDALYKYYGHSHRYLKTRDFYQMAGRAGRRGIDREGFVYMRINPHYIDLHTLEEIIYGEYEPIKSQLHSCYATIINLYKIMGERLYEIYPKSFHFQQANHIEKRDAMNILKNKVALLKYMRYILEDGISAKAELASKVYSFELQIGELFSSGLLEELNEIELFITICALVYEPRRGERKPKLTKKAKRYRRQLNTLVKSIQRIEKRFHIWPPSKKFHFHLVEAARAWYQGDEFSRIQRLCYSDEGEIVRYFRMAIQVLREMQTSNVISSSMKSKISACIKRINRDVVDAEKQLRQEI